jgi:hypothetical protein
VSTKPETLLAGSTVYARPGDADVITKRRLSGAVAHYFVGPIRDTQEEAEADMARWQYDRAAQSARVLELEAAPGSAYGTSSLETAWDKAERVLRGEEPEP